VSKNILINMESKVRIYSKRPELIKVNSVKIKKLYKEQDKTFVDLYIVCELKDDSRKYSNIENWTLYKEDDRWIVDYTSAF
jgi:hypothetical protein